MYRCKNIFLNDQNNVCCELLETNIEFLYAQAAQEMMKPSASTFLPKEKNTMKTIVQIMPQTVAALVASLVYLAIGLVRAWAATAVPRFS